MRTTNPPEFEPEPEVSPGLINADELGFVSPSPEVTEALEANPESTLRHDMYVNDIFLDIFRHEDNSGALAHAFEVSLSANDNGGSGTADRANGLAAWFRAKMEAGR